MHRSNNLRLNMQSYHPHRSIAALSVQHKHATIQHAAMQPCKMDHSTNMQRSPCNTQQRAPHNTSDVHRTTCSVRRATCDMQRAQVAFKTFGKLNADKSNVIVCVRPPAPDRPCSTAEPLSADVLSRCVPACACCKFVLHVACRPLSRSMVHVARSRCMLHAAG